MLFTRATTRLGLAPSAQLLTRRGFHATRAQLSSPYHYPEGPLSNLPFNPRRRGFAIKFIAYSVIGFGAPFAIAVWQTKKPKA
jgi:hypothetical protein